MISVQLEVSVAWSTTLTQVAETPSFRNRPSSGCVSSPVSFAQYPRTRRRLGREVDRDRERVGREVPRRRDVEARGLAAVGEGGLRADAWMRPNAGALKTSVHSGPGQVGLSKLSK